MKGKVFYTSVVLCAVTTFTFVLTRHSSFSMSGAMWMSANNSRSVGMEFSRGRIQLRMGQTVYMNETSALIDRVSGPTGFHLTAGDELPLDSWFSAESLVFADPSMKSTGSFLVFPAPLMIFLLAIPAILRIIKRLRSKKLQQSGEVPCPSCGYDLRASSGRCPECGSPKIEAA
jgi:hypothetical protein